MKRRRLQWILCLALLAAACAAALWWAVPWLFATPSLPTALDTRLTDRHGRLLGLVPGPGLYRCLPLPEGELPPILVRAVLAAEDKRFPDHGGIDLLALTRAGWGRLTGQSRSGASTITMQLAKLCKGNSARTLRAKAEEAMQARQWEMRHSKEDILRAYLNIADFGNQCRGAETAAAFYYGKTAASLTPAEAALLAAVLQAPSRLDPLRHPEAALKRRDAILRRMGESATAPLGASPHAINAPAHLSSTPGQLTIDAGLQETCAAIAREEVLKLMPHNVSQAAILVADNHSGEILARVPAALPESPRGGKHDGVSTPRSAGSTLKPFVYLMSFSEGAWPGAVLADVPTLYRSPDGIQAPSNYNNVYLGPITIRQALACSQNIPAMDALNRYGGVDRFLSLLHRLGFAIPGDKEEYGLGLAIGNAHVTLKELVQAYSTLARGGNALPLILHQIPSPPAEATPILNAADCYRIADILSDPSARATTFGPAPSLAFPFRCAAKTGTSSNFRDNWCIGFTGDYTVGVWVGNFDNTSMQGISGVSGAAPIFHRVMEALYQQGTPPTFPTQPGHLRRVEIDRRTGALATQGTPDACRASELATPEDLARLPQGRYDDQGRALLDARYTDWLKSSGMGHLYALDPTDRGGRRPAILIPAPGTTLTLDPTLPLNGTLVELRSTLPPQDTEWECSSLPIIQRGDTLYLRLRPGRHTVTATSSDGTQASSTFTVQSR